MMIAIIAPVAAVVAVVIVIIICLVKKKKAAEAMYDVNSSDKEDKDVISNEPFGHIKEKATVEQIEEDPYDFSNSNSPEPSSPQKAAPKQMKRKKTRKTQDNSLFVYNNMPKASKDSLEEDYDFERAFGSPVAQ